MVANPHSDFLPQEPGQLPRARYEQAERFLVHNAESLILNLRVNANWIGKSDAFWYVHERPDRHEYRIYRCSEASSEPAFDHARLAAELSIQGEQHLAPDSLNLDQLTFSDDLQTARLQVNGRSFECDLGSYRCNETSSTAEKSLAPRGSWNVLTVEHNLWLLNEETGERTQLTDDGNASCTYGEPLPSPLVAAGIEPGEPDDSAVGQWSPDGTKFLSFRLDSNGAGTFSLVQSNPLDGSLRPKLHTYTYPLPGDERVPEATLIVVDVPSGTVTELGIQPLPVLYYGHPLRQEWVFWSAEGSHVYVIRRDRGFKAYALEMANAATGESRVVVREESSVAIDPFLLDSRSPLIRVLEDSAEVIWFSQRDGWGHFYLYDLASGEQVRQLTSGAWNVVTISFVDTANRTLYFTGIGKEEDVNPHYEQLYRVSLDGGIPERLTPEDAAHRVTFSSGGQYFVDTFSTVETPPITVTRSNGGDRIGEVSRADISALTELGWTPPTRFVARGRDGKKTVHGILYLPTWFEPGMSLPVLDDIYAGPHVNRVPTAFADSIRGRDAGFFRNPGFWQAQAFAELGFAVVVMDGSGRPGRSKAEHNKSYMNVRDGGLPDHVAALKQLKLQYPFLDLDRVGIYGNSAGAFATVSAMLDFPDFFKAGVASGGNHDHRLDKASWVERYSGFPVGDHYLEQANTSGVERLKGKLLLIHSEMDENVHIASTLVLINALVTANKDFDLLLLPNQPHFCTEDPYFIRRRWDYFVTHLLRPTPPPEYRIDPPTN